MDPAIPVTASLGRAALLFTTVTAFFYIGNRAQSPVYLETEGDLDPLLSVPLSEARKVFDLLRKGSFRRIYGESTQAFVPDRIELNLGKLDPMTNHREWKTASVNFTDENGVTRRLDLRNTR